MTDDTRHVDTDGNPSDARSLGRFLALAPFIDPKVAAAADRAADGFATAARALLPLVAAAADDSSGAAQKGVATAGGTGIDGRIEADIHAHWAAGRPSVTIAALWNGRTSTNRGVWITSSIIAVNSMEPDASIKVPVSISGEGSPQYRIITDHQHGGTVTSGWLTTGGEVSTYDAVQIRLTSSSSAGVTRTATISFGGDSATFSVTTD